MYIMPLERSSDKELEKLKNEDKLLPNERGEAVEETAPGSSGDAQLFNEREMSRNSRHASNALTNCLSLEVNTGRLLEVQPNNPSVEEVETDAIPITDLYIRDRLQHDNRGDYATRRQLEEDSCAVHCHLGENDVDSIVRTLIAMSELIDRNHGHTIAALCREWNIPAFNLPDVFRLIIRTMLQYVSTWNLGQIVAILNFAYHMCIKYESSARVFLLVVKALVDTLRECGFFKFLADCGGWRALLFVAEITSNVVRQYFPQLLLATAAVLFLVGCLIWKRK